MKNSIYCFLIDDDEDDKEFFSLALKELDTYIEFDSSSTCADAISKLKSGKYKPNYIFLDLNMMPVNGMDCLIAIKKNPNCVDIPVIIYSTTLNERIIYETLTAGAFDHFEKPSKKADLVHYLKRVLQ